MFKGSIALLLVYKVKWQPLVKVEMLSDAMIVARKWVGSCYLRFLSEVHKSSGQDLVLRHHF